MDKLAFEFRNSCHHPRFQCFRIIRDDASVGHRLRLAKTSKYQIVNQSSLSRAQDSSNRAGCNIHNIYLKWQSGSSAIIVASRGGRRRPPGGEVVNPDLDLSDRGQYPLLLLAAARSVRSRLPSSSAAFVWVYLWGDDVNGDDVGHLFWFIYLVVVEDIYNKGVRCAVISAMWLRSFAL